MRLSMLPGFLLLLPLAEIAGFVVVGKAIGLWATLALVIMGFFAGLTILRQQGIGILRRMSAEGRSGVVPGRDLLRPAMLVIASILLIIPGFITDLVALLLFIPFVRDRAWQYVSGRFVVVGRSSNAEPGTQRGRGSATVVDLDEADYRREPSGQSPWSKHLGD